MFSKQTHPIFFLKENYDTRPKKRKKENYDTRPNKKIKTSRACDEASVCVSLVMVTIIHIWLITSNVIRLIFTKQMNP